MPFTFAHPAIVLPLAHLPKKAISLTALVIGSMTPDFEYFLRMRVYSIHSHTIPGLFYFDIPLGLLLFFIYRHVVKAPLIRHLPRYFKRRFTGFGERRPRISLSRVLIITTSIFMGAFSHLLWDAFTHPHGFFVEHIPALSSQITIAGRDTYFYKILQHTSTLVGFIVIGLTIKAMPTIAQPRKETIFKFWAMAVGVAFFVILLRLAAASFKVTYGDIIVTAIAGLFVGLIVACTYRPFRADQISIQ